MSVDLSALSSQYWLSGLLMGVAAAAPIGPVNILVIQRTLRLGRAAALILGAAAGLADALFAAAAAFGLGAIRQMFDLHHEVLRLFGGLFMIGFGVLLWRQSPHLDSVMRQPPSTTRMSLAVMVMTLTNPATLFWFLAAFAMFRFQHVGWQSSAAATNAAWLVFGVFCGSMLWWVALSHVAARLKERFSDTHLLWMNHGCAAVLCGFGLFAVATAY